MHPAAETSPGTAPDELDRWPASTGFLFWHVSLRWRRLIATNLRAMRLTHVQFVVLAVTWWLNRDRTPSQHEVAEFAALDEMMISHVLRDLADRGLLVRTADASDGRVRRITITDEGSDLARRAIPVVEATDREFFSALPDPERLHAVLLGLMQGAARPGPPTGTAPPADPGRPG